MKEAAPKQLPPCLIYNVLTVVECCFGLAWRVAWRGRAWCAEKSIEEHACGPATILSDISCLDDRVVGTVGLSYVRRSVFRGVLLILE